MCDEMCERFSWILFFSVAAFAKLLLATVYTHIVEFGMVCKQWDRDAQDEEQR